MELYAIGGSLVYGFHAFKDIPVDVSSNRHSRLMFVAEDAEFMQD